MVEYLWCVRGKVADLVTVKSASPSALVVLRLKFKASLICPSTASVHADAFLPALLCSYIDLYIYLCSCYLARLSI